jgi:hypothetical protein
MAPFRLVPDGFGRVSLEILYDRALGRPANAGLRFRLSRLSAPCFVTEQGELLPVISLNRRASNSSQATDVQNFHASNPECGEARVPLLAGDNRENSGFGQTASDAGRETDRQDFLTRRKMGVFRRPIAPRDDDSVKTRHVLAGSNRENRLFPRTRAGRPAGKGPVRFLTPGPFASSPARRFNPIASRPGMIVMRQ